MLANPLFYQSYLGFIAISQALSFKILSETVPLAKSLLSEYVVSGTKQALFYLFLHICFKLPLSLNFDFFHDVR